MIKIKGQFENGAQMRQELLALLGLDDGPFVTITRNDIPQVIESLVPSSETQKGVDPEPAVEEKPKRKSKAAEVLKANTGTEEPPASEATVENQQPVDDGINPETAPVVEETAPVVKEAQKYTLDDAKLAAAKLSRTGLEFRNKAKDIAFKYAQLTNPGVDKDAALVPKIAPEHYEAFIAEIEEAGK